jgi:nucleotide-binding universal stress UspA family protein
MSRAKDGEKIEKILVGVDGSEKSILALKWAAALAEDIGAHVEVMTTWQTPFPTIELFAVGFNLDLAELNERPMQIAHVRMEKSILGAYGTSDPAGVSLSIEEGYPALVLVERSKEVDLLVLGNRGHSPMVETLLGSVSMHCLSHAHCPVVIVKE